MLLIGAGLLIKSVMLFAATPLGISTKHVTAISMELPPWRYAQDQKRVLFYEEILAKAKVTPGVEGAGFSTYAPLAGGGSSVSFQIEGQPAPSRANAPNTLHHAITPGYTHAIGTALLQGRSFDGRDQAGSEPVAMIDREFAKRYFSHQNPIGQHIRLGDVADEKAPWLRVVGVVADEKDFDFFHEMSWQIDPMVFRPLAQEPPFNASLFLKSDESQGRLEAAVRKQVAAVDKDVPVDQAETLQERLSRVLAYPRFRAVLLGVFAGLALLLASVGLYGVLAQSVAQRTQEIGIRMALGAQKSDVLRMVVRQGMALAGMGVVLGLGMAWCLARFLAALLYGTEMGDVTLWAVVAGVLLVASLLAAYIPARRAARVDPMIALRYE